MPAYRALEGARRVFIIFILTLFVSFYSPVSWSQQAGPNPVYVLIWFDTEDYILPPSDDAAKRLADFMTAEGLPATFKVVGEKARTLERRGRTDVIASLRKHEIGYHANTHSLHPTPAEYESTLNWETGVAEFTRRERPGFEDVHRIFGKTPCCYGQPGSSWAPQSFAALRSWPIKVYLDEGSQVGLEGKPFWYGGLLNIFNTAEGEKLRPNESWDNLEQSKANFREFYARMSAQPGGGLISLYFHPCEFIHQWFWDLNFAHGANPPREEWKQPPQKAPAQQQQTFGYFEGLIRYMKEFRNVRFITGSQALALYPDKAREREFSPSELATIAKGVTSKVSFQPHGDYALSASETFELLNSFVSNSVLNDSNAAPLRLGQTIDGPSSAPPTLGKPVSVPWQQFSSTVLDVRDSLTINHRIPETVWLGSVAVPPEGFLVALAEVATRLMSTQNHPQTVMVSPAQLAAAEYVAKDSVKVWDWPIFPEGFHSEHLMELARLQAWTLKPAILNPQPTAPLGRASPPGK